MYKLIPFKKEINFKNNIEEITSITLENNLHKEDYVITGEFTVSGDYKLTSASVNKEDFSFKIPFEINMDERYILDNIKIDIDDFYYELIDNKVLSVHIDVMIDNLEEKEEIELIDERITIDDLMETEDTTIEKENNININEVNNIFDTTVNIDNYMTYGVYFIKDTDTIDAIIAKFNTTKEELLNYNDLNNIKVGDKLVIPSYVQDK